jgi:regulator of RNase E activity RraA
MDKTTMTTQHTLQTRLLALDTAAISDALDSLYIAGGLAGIKPQAVVKIAPAFTVKYEACTPEKNQFMNAGNYIDEVPAGAGHCRGQWRTYRLHELGQHSDHQSAAKGIAGSVIYGSARDIADIRQMGTPCFPAISIWFPGKTGHGSVRYSVRWISVA